MWACLGLWEISQDEVWQTISAPVSYVFYAASLHSSLEFVTTDQVSYFPHKGPYITTDGFRDINQVFENIYCTERRLCRLTRLVGCLKGTRPCPKNSDSQCKLSQFRLVLHRKCPGGKSSPGSPYGVACEQS